MISIYEPGDLAGPPGSDPVISRVHFLFKPVIPAAPEGFEATILLQFYSKPSPDSSTLVKAAHDQDPSRFALIMPEFPLHDCGVGIRAT
jgi:hypothetical protein